MMGPDRWMTTPRKILIVATACCAVIGLVCWTWPTVYLLGAAAGVGILVGGVEQLLHERREPAVDDLTAQEARDLPGDRCCVCGGPETPYENYRGQLFCWPCADCPCGQVPCVRTGINDPAVSAAAADPDASGRVPETARTHPDAGGEQRDDQAGEHPDASGQHAGPGHAILAALAEAIAALPAPAPRHPDSAVRDRVAAALVARIKQATISGPQPFGTDPMTRFLAANEYDLADVVLAELAPELSRASETRRLGLMVDEYAAGARGISDNLRQARNTLRETEGQLAETRGRLAARRQDKLRADQAEETIANVRRATDDARQCLSDLDPTEHPRPCGMCSTDHLAAVEAALDRPVIVEGA